MKALTVPTIFTAVDKLTGVLGRMQSRITGFAGTASAANARFIRSMQSVSSNAKSFARTSAIAGMAILTPLIYAAREAVKFEHSMAKVNTLAGVSGKQMAVMGKQVLDITRKIPVTAEEVAKGLYIINSAGIMGAKGLNMVTNSSKLAVAGIGSVEQAAHLMSSVFTVFGSEGNTSAQIYNKLALVVKMGKTTIGQMSEGFGKSAISVQLAGVHLNEFLSMVSALTVKGSSAAEAYNQIQGATQAMLKPSQSMLKAFRAMGFSGSYAGQQIIKHFGGLVPAMEAVNKALDRVGVRRAKAWGRIGAFIAQAALTPGGKAHEHFVENKKAMDTQPNAGENMFQTMLGTTDSQFKLLINNLKAFAVEVGLHLLPSLTKLAQKLSPIIDGVVNWMDANPGLTDTIIKVVAGIGAFLVIVAPIALTVGLIADAFALFGTVMTAFGVALEATPIGWIVTGIVALITLVTVIIKNWDDWGAAVTLFLGPLGLVISLFQSFRNNWEMIKKAFQTDGIIGGIKAVGKVILDALIYPIEQMFALIGKFTGWDWALNAAKGLHAFRSGLALNVMASTPKVLPAAPTPPRSFPKPGEPGAPGNRPVEAIGAGRKNETTVNINLNDPGKAVKSVTTSSRHIGIKVTSTMGRAATHPPERTNPISDFFSYIAK